MQKRVYWDSLSDLTWTTVNCSLEEGCASERLFSDCANSFLLYTRARRLVYRAEACFRFARRNASVDGIFRHRFFFLASDGVLTGLCGGCYIGRSNIYLFFCDRTDVRGKSNYGARAIAHGDSN